VWKAKRKLHPRILDMTGRLMSAMTSYRSSDVTTRLEKDKIVFTPQLTKMPYARIQQKGGHAGGVNIPARPYVRFSKSDQDAFAREILRHVMKNRSGDSKIGVQL
jgi:phage gpG-like protein